MRVCVGAQAERGLLGSRMLWTGVRVPRSIPSLAAQFPHALPSRLLALLSRERDAENGSLLTDSVLRTRARASVPALALSAPSPAAPLPDPTVTLTRASDSSALLGRLHARALGHTHSSVDAAMPTLLDAARHKFRLAVQFSGHRWFPVCCLKYDPTGRVIITGADDTCVSPSCPVACCPSSTPLPPSLPQARQSVVRCIG